jgi:hypothetical protein
VTATSVPRTPWESGDQPKVSNRSGARGLMQIMKCHDDGCTKLLGHKFDPYDGCDNIKCGVAVLANAVKTGNIFLHRSIGLQSAWGRGHVWPAVAASCGR